MSGFDSVFHEQPVNMIGMGIGPGSLPGMNIPHGYMGPGARPCGGIGGYDAAANEGRRLQDAAWDSVPTYNIHEPYKLPDTSASLPDLPRREPLSAMDSLLRVLASMETPDRYLANKRRKRMSPEPLLSEIVVDQTGPAWIPEIESVPIARQRGPLTIYEQTGDSHISHVTGKGFHVTTQVPGIGRDEGLEQGLSFHTYVEPGRKGRLKFDSDY